MPTDYYAVLGVDRDATSEEIKRAFRKVARQTHPDANPGDPDSEARFRQAAEAYEVLSDPERRRRYDRGDVIDLADLFSGLGGFDDLIRSVFGDSGLFSPSPGRPARGRDVLVRVEIGLAEAAFGTDAAVTFATRRTCQVCGGTGAEPESGQVTCPDCGGSGQVRSARRSLFGTMMTVTTCPTCRGDGVLIARPCPECGGVGSQPDEQTVTVEVPAGVTTGTRLRLSGRGESGGRAGPPGDLYVEVQVEPDPRFARHGDDLVQPLEIGIADAALGTRVEVPLLDGGSNALEVPAGTQTGTVFTLPGLGMTRLGRRDRGDLHIQVTVAVPEDLSPQERDLLQRFSELRGDRSDRPASTG